MIKSDDNIYIQETEIKPNHYALIVLSFTSFVVAFCWLMNELGFFHVGQKEMRFGCSITLCITLIPVILMATNKKSFSNPKMKYFVIIVASCFTFCVSTMLTFHTTIMLLFPIIVAMLYRSKGVGIMAIVGSILSTVFSPILGYLLGTWDIPLFQELIQIGTNGGVCTIVGGGDAPSLINIGKILLYLVFPRVLLVGSCAILLFNNIRLGVDHVNNQILLNRISNIDALTGLYNQNCYKKFLTMEQTIKPEKDIAILFFDVNGLKTINDSQGHEYGDLLLKRCAQSLLNICTVDTMAAFRVGGDEFLVAIEDANEAVAIQKTSQWEEKLKQINDENKALYDGLLCSMAVGFEVGKSSDIENIVRKADAYMYENKAKIKNHLQEMNQSNN